MKKGKQLLFSKGKNSPKVKKCSFARFKDEIPPLLKHSFAYLEHNATCVEGIFTHSAEFKKVATIINNAEKGKIVKWTDIDDPHLVAGVVKCWLCELNEPLLTLELQDSFIAAQGSSTEEGCLRRLATVIQLLPPGNRAIFSGLIRLFYIIDQRKEITKMAALNLAIVFGPVLLRSVDTELKKMLEHSEASTRAITYCICNYQKLFGEDSRLIDKKILERRVSTMGFNRKLKHGGLMLIRKMIAEELQEEEENSLSKQPETSSQSAELDTNAQAVKFADDKLYHDPTAKQINTKDSKEQQRNDGSNKAGSVLKILKNSSSDQILSTDDPKTSGDLDLDKKSREIQDRLDELEGYDSMSVNELAETLKPKDSLLYPTLKSYDSAEYLGSLLADEFCLDEELELQRTEVQEKQLWDSVSGRDSVPETSDSCESVFNRLDMLKFEAESLRELESMQDEQDMEAYYSQQPETVRGDNFTYNEMWKEHKEEQQQESEREIKEQRKNELEDASTDEETPKPKFIIQPLPDLGDEIELEVSESMDDDDDPITPFRETRARNTPVIPVIMNVNMEEEIMNIEEEMTEQIKKLEEENRAKEKLLELESQKRLQEEEKKHKEALEEVQRLENARLEQERKIHAEREQRELQVRQRELERLEQIELENEKRKRDEELITTQQKHLEQKLEAEVSQFAQREKSRAEKLEQRKADLERRKKALATRRRSIVQTTNTQNTLKSSCSLTADSPSDDLESEQAEELKKRREELALKRKQLKEKQEQLEQRKLESSQNLVSLPLECENEDVIRRRKLLEEKQEALRALRETQKLAEEKLNEKISNDDSPLLQVAEDQKTVQNLIQSKREALLRQKAMIEEEKQRRMLEASKLQEDEEKLNKSIAEDDMHIKNEKSQREYLETLITGTSINVQALLDDFENSPPSCVVESYVEVELPDGSRFMGTEEDSKGFRRGKLFYVDGGVYEGVLKDDVRSGLGTYVSPNGDKYIGEWENDMEHGRGRSTKATGETFDGDFVQGKPGQLQ